MLMGESKMFTRIHSFKFQNEFAKDSIKQKLETVALDFFKEGLLMQCFVDIDATNLFMINTWETAKSSEKIFENFKKKIFEQVKEMGVKISITGGEASVKFCEPKLLERFSRLKIE